MVTDDGTEASVQEAFRDEVQQRQQQQQQQRQSEDLLVFLGPALRPGPPYVIWGGQHEQACQKRPFGSITHTTDAMIAFFLLLDGGEMSGLVSLLLMLMLLSSSNSRISCLILFTIFSLFERLAFLAVSGLKLGIRMS